MRKAVEKATRRRNKKDESSGGGGDENGGGSTNKPPRSGKNGGGGDEYSSKNYKLAKELSEVRVKHREECKHVTRLTMENMNLASRCREALAHVASMKKELAAQKRKTAEAIMMQKKLSERLLEQQSQTQNGSKVAVTTPTSSPPKTDTLTATTSTATSSPVKAEDEKNRPESTVSASSSDSDNKLTDVKAEMERMDRIVAAHKAEVEEASRNKNDSPQLLPANMLVSSDDYEDEESTEEKKDAAEPSPVKPLHKTLPQSVVSKPRKTVQVPSPTGKESKEGDGDAVSEPPTPPPSRGSPARGNRFFPHSASPKLVRNEYNEEYPADIDSSFGRSSSTRKPSRPTLDNLQEEESESSPSPANKIMNSIDAFEASFQTNFPDSFSPKEDAIAEEEEEAEKDDTAFAPFSSSPSKEPVPKEEDAWERRRKQSADPPGMDRTSPRPLDAARNSLRRRTSDGEKQPTALNVASLRSSGKQSAASLKAGSSPKAASSPRAASSPKTSNMSSKVESQSSSSSKPFVPSAKVANSQPTITSKDPGASSEVGKSHPSSGSKSLGPIPSAAKSQTSHAPMAPGTRAQTAKSQPNPGSNAASPSPKSSGPSPKASASFALNNLRPPLMTTAEASPRARASSAGEPVNHSSAADASSPFAKSRSKFFGASSSDSSPISSSRSPVTVPSKGNTTKTPRTPEQKRDIPTTRGSDEPTRPEKKGYDIARSRYERALAPRKSTEVEPNEAPASPVTTSVRERVAQYVESSVAANSPKTSGNWRVTGATSDMVLRSLEDEGDIPMRSSLSPRKRPERTSSEKDDGFLLHPRKESSERSQSFRNHSPTTASSRPVAREWSVQSKSWSTVRSSVKDLDDDISAGASGKQRRHVGITGSSLYSQRLQRRPEATKAGGGGREF